MADRDPKAIALDLYARLAKERETSKVFRDVIASIAGQVSSEITLRGALRLAISAYDQLQEDHPDAG